MKINKAYLISGGLDSTIATLAAEKSNKKTLVTHYVLIILVKKTNYPMMKGFWIKELSKKQNWLETYLYNKQRFKK